MATLFINYINISFLTMKKFKFFAVMLVIACCAGFTSCGDDDDDEVSASEIVGKWNIVGFEAWEEGDGDRWETNSVSDADVTALEFNDNGTFKIYYRYDGAETGKYVVRGNQLNMELDDADEDDERATMTISQLTSTTLVLENSYSEVDEGTRYTGGEKYTFTRTK